MPNFSNTELDHVLDAYLDLEEDQERLPFLQKLQESNRELFEALTEMIEAEAAAPKILEQNALEIGASILHDIQATLPPPPRPSIDEYELYEEIGRGGMGVVYLGIDSKLGRKVAIKVLENRFYSSTLLERFKQEQHIQSQLEHPHIARIYNTDFTKEGYPFFAMEFIEGIPIDQYCFEQQLSLKERLYLFKKVLSAISFAHRNLIVHRDIKPSNILVTREGEVKLLDFGIAKIIDEGNSTGLKTNTHERLLTPIYAAPEQIRGELITTATDIYQSGILLCKIMTGNLPFRTNDQSSYSIQKAILNEVPAKPSSLILIANKQVAGNNNSSEKSYTPLEAAWSRKLKGDLDAVILKAIRKEPVLRYSSVDSFSDDINRYIKDLPVNARSGSINYRARKFVHRNQKSLAALGILAVLVAIFITSIIRQQMLTNRQAARANAAQSYILSVFTSVNPLTAEGKSFTGRDLVYKGIDGLDELDTDPMVKAAIMNSLGEIGYHFAEYEVTDSLYNESTKILVNSPESDKLELSNAYFGKGNVVLDLHGPDSAQVYFESSLKLRQSFLDDDHPKMLENRISLAEVLARKGLYDSAEPLFKIVYSFRSNPTLSTHHEVISAMDGLARIQFARGYSEKDLLKRETYFLQADSLYNAVYELRKNHLGLYDLRTGHSLIQQGNLALVRDSLEKALQLFEGSLHIYQTALEDSSDLIGLSLLSIAKTEDRLGRWEEAEKNYLFSAEMYEKSYGLSHNSSALPLLELSKLYIRQKQNSKSKEVLEKCIQILQSAPENNSTRMNLAMAKGLHGITFSDVYPDSANTIIRESYSFLMSNSASRYMAADLKAFEEIATRE